MRSVVPPDETDSVLIIDVNAVLTSAVTLEWFEPVSRRYPQVVQCRGVIQHQELSQRGLPEVRRRQASAFAGHPEGLGLGIGEAANHTSILTRSVINVHRSQSFIKGDRAAHRYSRRTCGGQRRPRAA